MEVRDFPQKMARLLSEEESSRIAQAKEEGRIRQEEIKEKLQKKNKKDDHKLFGLMGVGGVIGFIGGFFACIAQCGRGYYFINAIFICLGTWILCTFAGLAIGGLLGLLFANGKGAKQMEAQIHNEDRDYDIRVEQIHEEYRRKREEYEGQFMQEAERQKNYLAASPAVGELSGSYLQQFSSWIDAADRNANVGKIQIGTVFRITREAIQSEAGDFVFAKHRLQELLPVQQAGMARALQELLTAGLKERYPRDVSGGMVKIDSSVNMTEESVRLEMVYTADNGNYKAGLSGDGAGKAGGEADRDTKMWGW